MWLGKTQRNRPLNDLKFSYYQLNHLGWDQNSAIPHSKGTPTTGYHGVRKKNLPPDYKLQRWGKRLYYIRIKKSYHTQKKILPFKPKGGTCLTWDICDDIKEIPKYVLPGKSFSCLIYSHRPVCPEGEQEHWQGTNMSLNTPAAGFLATTAPPSGLAVTENKCSQGLRK